MSIANMGFLTLNGLVMQLALIYLGIYIKRDMISQQFFQIEIYFSFIKINSIQVIKTFFSGDLSNISIAYPIPSLPASVSGALSLAF